jgi:hypothetical protein
MFGIKRKLAMAALGAGTAALVLALGAPGTAEASTAKVQPTHVDSKIEKDVQAVLRLNPGSHRIADNAVEVKPGIVIRMHPNVVQSNIWFGCSNQLLCVWTDAGHGGYEKDFFTCQNVNLGDLTMPDGRPWNDKISSIVNNQTPGTVSRFYDYTGAGNPNDPANWYLLASVADGHRLGNLADNNDSHGRSINDRIDIVHVC